MSGQNAIQKGAPKIHGCVKNGGGGPPPSSGNEIQEEIEGERLREPVLWLP